MLRKAKTSENKNIYDLVTFEFKRGSYENIRCKWKMASSSTTSFRRMYIVQFIFSKPIAVLYVCFSGSVLEKEKMIKKKSTTKNGTKNVDKHKLLAGSYILDGVT